MNRILMITVLILVSVGSNAQVTDTLGFTDFQLGTTILYESPNGGYAFGNNGYGDKAKAQSYEHGSSFVLREALLLFGGVTFGSEDSSSVVRVNVYDNYGEGVTSFGESDSIAPASVIAFVDLPVYQLFDDGSYTTADFGGQALAIFSRFSIGVDFFSLAVGDTVGLMSTEDGDAGGTLNAWEKTANGTWFTVEESAFSWGLDVDLAIFPVIDVNDPAGVNEITEVDWSIFPNPTSGQLNLKFPSIDSWNILVHDVAGKLLSSKIVNASSTVMNLDHLRNGMYLVTISNEKNAVSKRISVLH